MTQEKDVKEAAQLVSFLFEISETIAASHEIDDDVVNSLIGRQERRQLN